LWLWAKRLFVCLAVGSLLYFGWQSREILAGMLAVARIPLLALAVLFWVFLHMTSPLFAVAVFRSIDQPVRYRDTLRIHLVNLPARYLPGGIWHTVGRAVSYRKLGISGGGIGLFILLENLLSVAVAFVMGGTVLFTYRGGEYWGIIAVFCAAAGGLLLLLLPALLRTQLFGYRFIVPSVRYYLAAIATVMLIWCAASAAFVAFIASFPSLQPDTSLLQTAAVYLFSWGVGFVAVFAPQGIGVFEVVAGELLRGMLALGGVAVLMAGFRLVILVADLLAWLAAMFLRKNRAV
jgi:hypothetical protein